MDSEGKLLKLDPCVDERWTSFVGQHPRAGVFHQPSWLEALRQTYGYRSVAYCKASKEGRLVGGIVFCEIRSWLTGKRLVSLPFSDHCEPLVDSPNDVSELLAPAADEMEKQGWRYIEIRPLSAEFAQTSGTHSERFVFHRLDLRPTTEELFRNLHVDSIRRKIQKAAKAGLCVRNGQSEELLTDFYGLHVLTRKRHLSPPHPLGWFRNVLRCLGKRASVRIAYKEESPAAAVFTLESNQSVIYKYGCSDGRFHSLGAMPFVFWDMILDAKAKNLCELDLGRSDLDNPGLILFKEKWGAKAQPLLYARTPPRAKVLERGSGAHLRKLIAYCPEWLLIGAGKLLYPHVG
jgi:hypothetical protein